MSSAFFNRPAATSPSATASSGGRMRRVPSTHTALVSSRIVVKRCASTSAASKPGRSSDGSDARTCFSSLTRDEAAAFWSAAGDSAGLSAIIDRTCDTTNVGSSLQSGKVGSASPCTRKPYRWMNSSNSSAKASQPRSGGAANAASTAVASPELTTFRTPACLRATCARSYNRKAGFELSTLPSPLHSPTMELGSPPPSAITPARRTCISPAAVLTT